MLHAIVPMVPTADTATFIGIDLAWQSERNTTGVAVFRGDPDGASLVTHVPAAESREEIVGVIRKHETAATVIAIDAPLIVPNQTGQRPCERSVTSRFGGAHAGCHPSNRTLHPQPGGVLLAEALKGAGYSHCTTSGTHWMPGGRWLAEVYPHPAHVVLFGRERIVKYKRGRVAAKRLGLTEFRALIRQLVFESRPSLIRNAEIDELFSVDIRGLRGKGLKQYEDTLDAILCAYLAFRLWRWGWERSEMIGDLQNGYIVIPTAGCSSEIAQP